MSAFSSLLVMLCVVLVALGLYGLVQDYRVRVNHDAATTLSDMFLFIDPQRLFFVNMGILVLVPVVVLMLTASVPLAFLITICSLFLPRLAYAFLKGRRKVMLVHQMPDALNMLGGSLRSGASLALAMDLVANETPAPFSQEISLVLREQKLGVSLEDAFESMGKRLDMEEVDLIVSAITISKSVGGNLAEVLERLANTLRAKAAMEGKIKALTSQGKLQGIVVGLLPVFLAFVLFQMEPQAMEPLFTTWYGWATVAVVLVFLVVGAFFIRKIINIDV